MGLGWLISKKLASRIAKRRRLDYLPFLYCNFYFGRKHNVKYSNRSKTQDDGSWASYYKCQNFHCNYKETWMNYDNSQANPETHPHLAFAQDPEDDSPVCAKCGEGECARFDINDDEEVSPGLQCHICLSDEEDCNFCRGIR